MKFNALNKYIEIKNRYFLQNQPTNVGASIKPGVKAQPKPQVSFALKSLAHECGRQQLWLSPTSRARLAIANVPGVSRYRATPQALCWHPLRGLKSNRQLSRENSANIFLKFSLKFLLIFFAVSISTSLFAQKTSTVSDSENHQIKNAHIILRNENGVIIREITTDKNGEFTLPDLRTGNYSITAEAEGMIQIGGAQKITINKNSATPALQLKLQIAAIKDSIIVSATRTDNNLSETPASAYVISANDLARSQRTHVLDALRGSPGVSVMQSARRGGVTSIFVRGGESDYTKVLVDGIPINDAGGAFDLSDFTTENAERIEFVRGSNSALYGSDAMSGVLQFITKRGTSSTPEIEFSAEGGSFAFNRQVAKISGANNGFDYSASFAHLRTNGRGRNDDYQNRTASANLGYRFSERTNLRFMARSENSGLGVPGATANYFSDPDDRARRRRIATGIKLDDQTSRLWHQQFSFVFAENNQLGIDPVAQDLTKPNTPVDTNFAFNDFVSFFNNHQKRRGLRYQSDFVLPKSNLLSTGIEYEKESSVFDSGSRVAPNRRNIGFFVQDQFFAASRFVLTAGLRVENNRTDLPPSFASVLKTLGSKPFTGSVGFGTKATPKFSALIVAHKGDESFGATKFRASYGAGIKAPTLVETFSPNSFFLGNPGLKPERAQSFDAGIEQLFWRDRVRVEATFFANYFRDQIAYVGDPASFGGPVTTATGVLTSFINNDRARARGVELSLAIRPTRSLSLSGNYTLTDSKLIAAAPIIDFNSLKLVPNPEVGFSLLRRPKHSGTINVAWTAEKFALNLDGFFIGKRRDVDPVTFSRFANSKGYQKVDVASSYQFTPHITGFTRIENLLNQNYQEVLGYPAYRLNFSVGVKINLSKK